MTDDFPIGALHSDGETTFKLYAPNAGKAWVVPEGKARPLELTKDDAGYFAGKSGGIGPGARYRLRTDLMREPRPDPASRSQPDGVHAASEVVDRALLARQQPYWPGRELRDMILYELHVGTFSPAGTFDGAIELLPDIVKLGVNAIELMPINQFPGERNWGYDGVYWQAPHNSYGGPAGLVRLIDAAHELDLAVIIDAVFNHLGPEGNYLQQFAPYLTDKYHTPWGPAINLDDYHSDGVREFIYGCAKTWLVDYGADGLRLDAVHALRDSSAVHVLEELSFRVKSWSADLRRPLTLIGECDLNDPRYVKSLPDGGLGLDGQWVDEFHHALRTHLTGENRGYYRDFGSKAELLKTLRTGYVFTGEYSPHRGRTFGRPTRDLKSSQFVVFAQNHDQVGNRARGERLSEHLGEDDYCLAAAITIWSPYTPMLWMGEEYAETRPFPYFVDHGDEAVLTATREGRMREFAPFLADGEQVPDPGDAATFESAKLTHRRRGRVYKFYREALAVRRQFWPLLRRKMTAHDVEELRDGVVAWRLPMEDRRFIIVIVNLGNRAYALPSAPPSWSVTDAQLRCSTLAVTTSVPPRCAGLWLSAH